MTGPESPSPDYIEARIGRAVRVERHSGDDVSGRLVSFDGADLTIDSWWMGQPTTVTVPVMAVRALWVSG